MFDKLRVLVRLLAHVSRHRARLNELIMPLLQRESVSVGEEFTVADLKKIEQNYGIIVPLVLGNMMSSIHGRALTTIERETLTLMGAITGLYDDFFDRHQLPQPTIRELTTTYSISSDVPANIKAYQVFLSALVSRLPDVNAFEKSFLNLFEAQTDSLQQRSPLPANRLMELSDRKGGRSLQFYRTAFSPAPDEAEQEFWFHTGALGQLCNDIFDLYKDQQEGIYTFAGSCGSVAELREQFDQYYRNWRTSLLRLPMSAWHRERCAHYFQLTVVVRTRVCLEQLALTEKRLGHYQTRTWAKADLIVDMETKANLLRQLRYYFAP